MFRDLFYKISNPHSKNLYTFAQNASHLWAFCLTTEGEGLLPERINSYNRPFLSCSDSTSPYVNAVQLPRA